MFWHCRPFLFLYIFYDDRICRYGAQQEGGVLQYLNRSALSSKSRHMCIQIFTFQPFSLRQQLQHIKASSFPLPSRVRLLLLLPVPLPPTPPAASGGTIAYAAVHTAPTPHLFSIVSSSSFYTGLFLISSRLLLCSFLQP